MTGTAAMPLPPLRVAVVDDESVVRLPVVALLEDAGLEVVEYDNPHQALTGIAGRTDIALVLTDVNMPGMDGTALALRLRALRPDLPVVLMSGQARPPGIVHFIAKPFGQDALLRVIGNALDNARPREPPP
jgi:FixJ family two-component response regulator